MIKMVAFDLDGTIAHTMPVGLQAFTEGALPFATKEITTDEIYQTYGLNEKGMIKRLLDSHHDEAYNAYYALYEKYHEVLTEPYEGIREIFAYLQEKNIKISLITGRGHQACMYTLDKLQIKDVFCDIEPGDEDRQRKCEIIHILMDKYKLSADEIIYVGDAVSDVVESNNAGIKCISACWGHDLYIEDVKKINHENVIHSTEEMLNYFKEHFDKQN